MVDLVLIRAHGRDDGRKALPFGLLSLATYLQKYRFSVEIIDRMKNYQSIAKCAKIINDMSPRMIGISAMSNQYEDAILLGRKLKEVVSAKIIYGGQHFTILPQEGLKFGDAVVRYEGEKILLELCKMDNINIKGIFEGQSLSNLDEIPLPSDEMLKDLYQGGEFCLLTSRGCPFECIFCKNVDYVRHIKYHSIEYVCDYIEKAVNLLGIKSCFIADDIFTINKDRVIRFCEEIRKRNLKLEFTCFTHANINDFQMYTIMKDAGFHEIQIGVESGNDVLLKTLKKSQTVKECIRTIEIIKKAGLSPIPLFMIGNITETEATIRDTIELAKRLRSICDYGWFSYAQPFPGTEFYEVATKYGRLINQHPYTYWNTRISFIPNGLTKSKMEKMGAMLAKVLRPTYPPLGKRIKSRLKKKIKSLIKRIIPKKYHIQVDLYGRYFFLSFLYAGTKFECPFCGGHFRKFLPGGFDFPVLKEKNVVGGGYRSTAMCPRCRSFDRERHIYLYLKNKTEFFYKNHKVLHVAPEMNLQMVIMQHPNIDYISADLSSPLAMDKMDIKNIKYEDNSFDVIICCHVLEHIPDDWKAMSELYRVLKPGSWAILQVPTSLFLSKTYEDPMVTTPEGREKAFGQSDHVRIYAKDYKDRLEKIGFSVEIYNSLKEFGESTMRKYGLLKGEYIYICSKPRRENA